MRERGEFSPSSPDFPPVVDREDEDNVSEDEDGEELIGGNMADDYRRDAVLDNYDEHDLESEEDVEYDHEARQAAERHIRHREERAQRQQGRQASALMFNADDDADDEFDRPRRRELSMQFEGDNTVEFDLDHFTGNLREHQQLVSTKLEVRRRFSGFLASYTEGSGPIYMDRVNAMCSENKQSFLVSYSHLSMAQPKLALWQCEHPEEMQELFNIAAMDVVTTAYPTYLSVHPQVYTRVIDVPAIDSIMALREKHLHSLIRVVGVVIRRSNIFPQLRQLQFNCLSCGESIGPFLQEGVQEAKPNRCYQCHSTGPFKLNISQTVFRNYQKVTIQEPPGSVPAGRIPRQKEVILLQDLVDGCAPGEEITVTGIYNYTPDAQANSMNGFPVFSTVIVANSVVKRNQVLELQDQTDADTRLILELSKKPNINEQIINSIAPSIYGHNHIKTCVAMSQFGGVAKEATNKHRLRGDINVLVLGDPGTAKSQILKYCEKIAPRAVYTTGKGASAVGLTASVRMDPLSREWTLEGGALVLADQGVCLIDEFDKMSEQDRVSIHEAMEQQSISVSKAGIICTLKARCGVIAAANPIAGKYNPTKAFQDQVDLTEPILSRFDCLCVVRDTVDSKNDVMLANFVVSSHMKSHPNNKSLDAYQGDVVVMNREQRQVEMQQLEAKKQIPQDLLKKYIAYAKKHCQPRLHNIDQAKISQLYKDQRKAAATNGGIQITPRHIESVLRMSEAHAKMALREFVSHEDVNVAIKCMLESFISSQKMSVKQSLERQFKHYVTFNVDRFELLLNILKEHVNQEISYRQTAKQLDIIQARALPVEIPLDAFMHQASNKAGTTDVTPFLHSEQFKDEGYTFDSQRKIIVGVSQ